MRQGKFGLIQKALSGFDARGTACVCLILGGCQSSVRRGLGRRGLIARGLRLPKGHLRHIAGLDEGGAAGQIGLCLSAAAAEVTVACAAATSLVKASVDRRASSSCAGAVSTAACRADRSSVNKTSPVLT